MDPRVRARDLDGAGRLDVGLVPFAGVSAHMAARLAVIDLAWDGALVGVVHGRRLGVLGAHRVRDASVREPDATNFRRRVGANTAVVELDPDAARWALLEDTPPHATAVGKNDEVRGVVSERGRSKENECRRGDELASACEHAPPIARAREELRKNTEVVLSLAVRKEVSVGTHLNFSIATCGRHVPGTASVRTQKDRSARRFRAKHSQWP